MLVARRELRADPVRQLVHPPERRRRDHHVRLRLHADGRTAGGSTTVVDADGLRGAGRRARSTAARLLPPDPGWPGLAPPAPASGAGGRRRRDRAGVSRTERARAGPRLRRRGRRAGDGRLLPHAYQLARRSRTRPASPCAAPATEAAMDGIARAGGGATGCARAGVARRLADLDGARARRARGGEGARRRRPGRAAAGPLRGRAGAVRGRGPAEHLAVVRLQRQGGQRRRSFARARRRRSSTRRSRSSTTPLGRDAIGLPFDAEGTPEAPARAGPGRASRPRSPTTGAPPPRPATASTGHALRRAPARARSPTNLRLLPAGRRRPRRPRWTGRWPTRPWPPWSPASSGGCWSPTSGTPGCSTRDAGDDRPDPQRRVARSRTAR